MNLSCIILNYNDACTTRKLVNLIKNYQCIDSIVIVDNHSTDDSLPVLEALKGGKLHLLTSPSNGGYGAGNNIGIRYAYHTLGATHVLIANPDVEVSEACIQAMKDAFGTVEKLAVAAAVTRDPKGKVSLSSWRLHGLFLDILDTGLITRRLFAPFLNDRPELKGGKGYARVDAVLGSLFMADAKALMECGLYDEAVFLYCEEKILGYQLKEKGFQTVLLLEESYIHHHSVSINKSVASMIKKQAILHDSKLHYYKKYLKINPFQEICIRIFLYFLLMEIWFLTQILGITW